MRRALRKITQNEIEVKAGKDAQFIDSITQLIIEIAKSDIKISRIVQRSPPKVSAKGKFT